MDRSLKWRTLALLVAILTCVGVLLPTFVGGQVFPSWMPGLFRKEINFGLDLQGGLHIVYSIDLDTAVVDKAGEIKRDLETRFHEEPKVDAEVRTPLRVTGGVTVVPKDANKRGEIEAAIRADYADIIESRACEPTDPPNSICIKVSTKYAEDIKKSALSNAVTTIRERIDEKGIAEPSVVEKDDQIIVELPGLDSQSTQSTKDVIKRTAKLEFKIVDNFSPQMAKIYAKAAPDDENKATDPRARELGIYAVIDDWVPDEGERQQDYYLFARDRKEWVGLDRAEAIGCKQRNDETEVRDGKVYCDIKGWHVIDQWLSEIGTADPSLAVPDDREVSYELVEPSKEAEGMWREPHWRSYYLDRAVELTGTSIKDARASYDPNTNRPIVLIDFNRYGSRMFGDLTAKIIGKKLAAILDKKVKSAPIINTAIRGGSASITMGGGNDAQRQQGEADELVNVLRTGSLPAPLREDSSSEVGPTLGRDAIDKTKVSFALGILLVIIIMVGIYRWSGWISVFAIVFHNLLTLAVMTVFGATLTLPGIAAIVLSVGMCVDGNILIYERIRDELLLGKSVRGAVDLGFTRAFSAILDGQLTTAAAGWVLLQYGSGPIRGFAVLLLVGVFTTLFTNIWVTRILFDWYIAKKKGQSGTISI
ncbi:MAG: protein translocase subunit SecD [Kofleriaceae bacterium]